MWQSGELSKEAKSSAQEIFFDDGSFPPAKETLAKAAELIKNDEERPLPFGVGTEPAASHAFVNVERNLQDWLSRLEKEEERPNAEQMSVLVYVKDRIVEEPFFREEGARRRVDVAPASSGKSHFADLCMGYLGRVRVELSSGSCECLRRRCTGVTDGNLYVWHSRTLLHTQWADILCIPVGTSRLAVKEGVGVSTILTLMCFSPLKGARGNAS